MNFFTWELLIKAITAFLSSVGFAIILRISPRHLIEASLGGMMTYLIYYTVMYFGLGYFAAGFISTTFAALFAETMARVKRAPAIVYLLPGVIPTVPGGDLYRGMRDLISGSIDTALANFSIAVNIALGIAGGIVTVSILFGIITDNIKRIKAKRNQADNRS